MKAYRIGCSTNEEIRLVHGITISVDDPSKSRIFHVFVNAGSSERDGVYHCCFYQSPKEIVYLSAARVMVGTKEERNEMLGRVSKYPTYNFRIWPKWEEVLAAEYLWVHLDSESHSSLADEMENEFPQVKHLLWPVRSRDVGESARMTVSEIQHARMAGHERGHEVNELLAAIAMQKHQPLLESVRAALRYMCSTPLPNSESKADKHTEAAKFAVDAGFKMSDDKGETRSEPEWNPVFSGEHGERLGAELRELDAKFGSAKSKIKNAIDDEFRDRRDEVLKFLEQQVKNPSLEVHSISPDMLARVAKLNTLKPKRFEAFLQAFELTFKPNTYPHPSRFDGHTPGLWLSRESGGGSVVGSGEPTTDMQASAENMKEYMGALICESVSNKQDKELIVNAPSLLFWCKEAMAELIALQRQLDDALGVDARTNGIAYAIECFLDEDNEGIKSVEDNAYRAYWDPETRLSNLESAMGNVLDALWVVSDAAREHPACKDSTPILKSIVEAELHLAEASQYLKGETDEPSAEPTKTSD